MTTLHFQNELSNLSVPYIINVKIQIKYYISFTKLVNGDGKANCDSKIKQSTKNTIETDVVKVLKKASLLEIIAARKNDGW
jgi:hypothetical protein